jgi:hypothetical protein
MDPTAAVSAPATVSTLGTCPEPTAAAAARRGFAGEPLSAAATAMVAVAAASSVVATTLAPLPNARGGMRARTLALSAHRAFGGTGSGPCRNPRSERVASFRLTAASASSDVFGSAGFLWGASAAVMSGCRRREMCGRRTRSVTFGRRRRLRLRRSLCGAPASAAGSGLRQSSATVASGATADSSVAAALRARPVICPVRRSVSYQSSSAISERDADSSTRRRLTVASGGGSLERLPLPESLSIGARIR